MAPVPGEEKLLKLTFPEDYQKEDLAGADVEFKVSLSEVQELELAASTVPYSRSTAWKRVTEDDFRAEVKQNMERELRNAVEASVKTQVMDAIVAAHQELELPASLIAQEVNAMRQQMFQQFGGAAPQDMDLASILPDEMFAEQAEAAREAWAGRSRNDQSVRARPRSLPRCERLIEDIASTYQDPGRSDQLVLFRKRAIGRHRIAGAGGRCGREVASDQRAIAEVSAVIKTRWPRRVRAPQPNPQ